jgi:hypothetical protein
MPGRKIKITDDQRKQLAVHGYTPVEMQVAGVKKVTLWKQIGDDWLPHPNMPGDPWSLQKYLKRGFLLAPPGSLMTEHPDYVVSDPSATGEPLPALDTAQGVAPVDTKEQSVSFPCEICGGKPFKSNMALKTHDRKSRAHKNAVRAALKAPVAVT